MTLPELLPTVLSGMANILIIMVFKTASKTDKRIEKLEETHTSTQVKLAELSVRMSTVEAALMLQNRAK